MTYLVYKKHNTNFVGRKKEKYFLPKNFDNESSNEEFEKEFEIFINKFIQELQNKNKTYNCFSPQIVKKAHEDGDLDEEMTIHSSKLEAWSRLERKLRKTIINKPSAMHRYTDIFKSKSIERTISRGTFLLALNNSPIFNQGLLNIDETYRVHYKDELYKFASFILDLYKEKLSIKQDMKSIFKSLSKDFQNEYGFKGIDLNDKKTKNRLISTLENIEKHIELLTSDIKELISSVKNLIFGKDTIVGIDNFQLAWEYLFTSCMKKIHGEDFVFDENEISIPETENYRNNNVGNNTNNKVMIKPDTIIIDKETVDGKSTLHIYDCKYKKFPIVTDNLDKDWIKQSIYIDNFLSTEINPLQNNLLVDSNIYLIYPGSEISCYKKREYNYYIYLIKLDILELLKIYNGVIDKSLEDLKSKFLKDLCINENKNNCFYPHIRNKPYVPKNCFDGNNILPSSFNNTNNNSDNRYSRYKEYLFGDKECTEENTNLTCYYFATKSVKFDGSKYSFE